MTAERRQQGKTVRALGAALVCTASLLLAGCLKSSYEREALWNETNIDLRSANFRVSKVHAVGSASCRYLLGFPLCRRPDIVSQAFAQMRAQAEHEGKAAYLVNVSQDRVRRWNIVLFWVDSYFVSADAVAFLPGPAQ